MISRASWTAWAWAQRVRSSDKLLLLALADRVDIDTGLVAAGSMPKVAAMIGVGESTVHRSLRRLVDCIERFEAFGPRGRQIWRYRLRAPWLTDQPAQSETRWSDMHRRSLARKGSCIHSLEACDECRDVSRLDYKPVTAQSARVMESR